MRTRLPSGSASLYKGVVGPFWILGIGAANLALWLGLGVPIPSYVKLYVFGLWLIGSAYIIQLAPRLSDVWMEGSELIVVRGEAEERIPLAAVEEVSETNFVRPKQIKLRIRPGAVSSDTVVFLAPWRTFVFPYLTDPVTRDLRAAVDRALARAVGQIVSPRSFRFVIRATGPMDGHERAVKMMTADLRVRGVARG